MKPSLLLFLAPAFLAACTPMQWVKEDASAAQLEADSQHCQQEAWREARFRAWAWGPSIPLVMRDAAGRPFVSYPYAPFSYPFGDPFMEESRLAQFCMRAKGWRLEAIPDAK